MWIIGAAAFALALAIVSVSEISGAAAAEATTIMGPSPTLQPLPLVNRQDPWLSETDGRVGDREQLRKYFLQDRRDWLTR
jgi:hypothetical protein